MVSSVRIPSSIHRRRPQTPLHFCSRYSVIEVCFVLFVCAFLFCVFVEIVGLTSAAMEEDDGFSTTFVFTHASASARAEKLFNKNRERERTFMSDSRDSFIREQRIRARKGRKQRGGGVLVFTLCCAFGNENTCFLHSSQVSYTPGFRPLATA